MMRRFPVKKTFAILIVLVCRMGVPGLGQALPDKVGIVHTRQAIIQTTEGKKVWADFRSRFEQVQKDFQKRQSEIEALQQQLERGRHVMAAEAQQKIQREIESRSRAISRDSEERQAEFDEEQARVVQDLKRKFLPVIEKYARERGFSLIIDIDVPNSPILFAVTGVNVTEDLAKLYDQVSAQTASAQPPPKP